VDVNMSLRSNVAAVWGIKIKEENSYILQRAYKTYLSIKENNLLFSSDFVNYLNSKNDVCFYYGGDYIVFGQIIKTLCDTTKPEMITEELKILDLIGNIDKYNKLLDEVREIICIPPITPTLLIVTTTTQL
jgi:aldehyde:ferredoxin oxidoreductase